MASKQSVVVPPLRELAALGRIGNGYSRAAANNPKKAVKTTASPFANKTAAYVGQRKEVGIAIQPHCNPLTCAVYCASAVYNQQS